MPKLSEIRAKFPMYADVPDEQLVIGLHRQFYRDMPFAEFNKQIEYDNKADPTEGMSGLDKFRAGVGKAFADTGRGLGQWVGAVSRDDVAESRKRDEALMKTGAGTAGNLLGNVAITAPIALVPGANTVVGGGLIGAATGLAQPSASTSETLTNAGVGGVAGAAIPTIVNVARAGRSLVEPFYQGGRNRILGRALEEASGGQGAQVRANLQNARPLVPGSLPTAGQAAQNPGIAALERTAVQTDPVAANQMEQRLLQQNRARIAALQAEIPDRAAAVQARDAAATGLYAQADAAPVSMTQQLADLLRRPSGAAAVDRARRLAAESGQALDLDNLTGQNAHRIKMGLDDAVNSGPQTGIGGNELRAMEGTRADFLNELEQQLPVYGQARQAYAAGSRPVNQSDVLTEILERSTNNFRDNMTPAAMHSAATDRTAQRVLRQPNAELANVLEPQQAQTLQNIQDDLLRADYAARMRGAGSDTVQKLAYSNILSESGVPAWARNNPFTGTVGNIVSRVADAGYKRQNDELRQQLAQALLDPQQTAALMQAAQANPQLLQLVNALRSGGAALGAATPGLIQANQ